MIRKNQAIRNISLVLIVLLLMALIFFLVGKTFGFFQYAKKGDVINVVSIKGLEVEVLNEEDDALNLAGAYPVYDNQGMQNDAFEFTLTNVASKSFDIILKVENDTEKQTNCKLEDNVTPCTVLSTNYIRYSYALNDGTYSAPANLGSNENIILTKVIDPNETVKVSLKIWIDKDAPNSIQGNVFFGSLIVSGEKLVSNANVTLYSAALDTVYYYANNDTTTSPINLGTTDATGKLENVTIDYGIIYYSSIAKDPNNLSNSFSKSFNNLNDTAYLMPDGEILYWYGYMSDGCEEISTANGWTTNSGITPPFSSPTYNTNNIYGVGNSGWTNIGIGSKNTITAQKAYGIANFNNSNQGLNSSQIKKPISANYNIYYTFPSNQLTKGEIDISLYPDNYIFITLSKNTSGYIYALWYE